MKNISQTLTGLALVFGLTMGPAFSVSAQSEKSPEAAYKNLAKQHSDLVKEYSTAIRAAKTTAEKQVVYKEKFPNPATIGKKMVELAKANPKTKAATDALIWAATYDYCGNAGGEAMGILADGDLKDSRISRLTSRLKYSKTAGARKLMAALMEKSTDPTVKGQMLLAMAQSKKESDPKAAEKHFQELIEKYGTVKSGRKTFGEMAKAEIFDMKQLGAGQPMPEIEGEDIDGVKFKLSDYRGKVVLVDFWGDW